MIKFPRVHIATSVQNRILNLRDELNSSAAAPQAATPVPPPDVPDPALAGAVIDAQVSTPPPANVPPLEAQEPAADELGGMVARGDDLISV